MDTNDTRHPNNLAWHETMELHELVAFQSFGLMKLKDSIDDVKDTKLKKLYKDEIKGLERNIRDLLEFFSVAPMARDEDDEYMRALPKGFYAADLLIFAKTSVRNYAIAITETATPVLRDTLNKQLQRAIAMHGRIFNYMYENGLYPAYDLKKLIRHDMNNAQKALDMKW